MTYSAMYCALISKRLKTPPDEGEYFEVHHIIPKSEGGDDTQSNLVKLTAREHYIAHLMLARIYNDAHMYSAVLAMRMCHTHSRTSVHFNSRLYSYMRRKFSAHQSERMSGENNPWYGKHSPMFGRKQSSETRRKISLALKGKGYGFRKGHMPWSKGVPCSEETKRRISETLSGRCVFRQTEQSKLKNSIAHLGIAKGKRWWNNGVVCVMRKECPEGFVSGRLYKMRKNTNG